MTPIVDRLRQAGLKATPQRLAIYQAVKDLDHPTAGEVYEHVKKTSPAISLNTVYTTLQRLAELGEVQKIPLVSQGVRYDLQAGDHPHLACVNCDGVENLPEEVSHWAMEKVDSLRLGGAQVHGLNLIFYGTCKKCQ